MLKKENATRKQLPIEQLYRLHDERIRLVSNRSVNSAFAFSQQSLFRVPTFFFLGIQSVPQTPSNLALWMSYPDGFSLMKHLVPILHSRTV